MHRLYGGQAMNRVNNSGWPPFIGTRVLWIDGLVHRVVDAYGHASYQNGQVWFACSPLISREAEPDLKTTDDALTCLGCMERGYHG